MGNQAYKVCLCHSCYLAFSQVPAAKSHLFQAEGGSLQALHCHSHTVSSTGCGYTATQVSWTMVQTHHPAAGVLFTPPAPAHHLANLLSSLIFFSSCFSCLTLAYCSAFYAWQQLEKSIGIFKSSPVTLQLQNFTSEVQAWSWCAPNPGVYHFLKVEFVEKDKLFRRIDRWKEAILLIPSLGTKFIIKVELQEN